MATGRRLRGKHRGQSVWRALFLLHWPGKASLIRCCLSKKPDGGKEQAMWFSQERRLHGSLLAHPHREVAEAHRVDVLHRACAQHDSECSHSRLCAA